MKQTAPQKPAYDTTGIITRMVPGQGYAFVRGKDGTTSFAHADEFKQPDYDFERAREGHSVSYRVTHDGDRGNKQRARDIKLIGEY
jgi:cold shock CspA family protein